MTVASYQVGYLELPGPEILRVEVGSTAHGTSIDNQDDTDYMGICVEPARVIYGLERFDQVVSRDRQPDERSLAGDVDLVVYGLKKWMALAVKGNPSILMMLFGPVVSSTPHGQWLRENSHLIVSRRALGPYGGYMRAQALRMMGLTGGGHGRRGGAKRPELVDQHGYDTKFAMHMVRLGFQGIELMTTGKITLPMTGEAGDYCRAVRRGEVGADDVLHTAFELDAQLHSLRDDEIVVADEPDLDALSAWMRSVYLTYL